jgi:hypothetical protein
MVGRHDAVCVIGGNHYDSPLRARQVRLIGIGRSPLRCKSRALSVLSRFFTAKTCGAIIKNNRPKSSGNTLLTMDFLLG